MTLPASAPGTAGTAPWRADLRISVVWALLAGLAAAAVLPYLVQMMPGRFTRLPLSLPALALLQGLQATLLCGVLALLGLRMGHRLHLGSPLLRGWLGSGPPAELETLRPWRSLGLGVVTALAVIALSLLVDPLLPEPVHPPQELGSGASALNGLLASFYGGIVEELQLRLFLMTLLLWIVARVQRRQPRPGVYWMAIVTAALLFGIGHLPAAGHVWGLDALVVLRTLLLNGVAGVVFGWLYWKRGLEMAVLAHFAADVVLHALTPLLSGALP